MFCPVLNYITKETLDIKHFIKKILHLITSFMILTLNTVLRILFTKKNDLFIKSYMPKYKLIVLAQLKLKFDIIHTLFTACNTKIKHCGSIQC